MASASIVGLMDPLMKDGILVTRNRVMANSKHLITKYSKVNGKTVKDKAEVY
jgi:hypothetical protein